MQTCKDTKTKKHKVFIVDNQLIMREGLTLLINRSRNFTVCGDAGDSSTTLKSIGVCLPYIVLVDLSLEFGSGIRLIENISYSYPDIKILVLSTHDESVYAERCFKAGARGYLMKQASSEEVIQALQKLVNGEPYISEQLNRKFLNKFILNNMESDISFVDILSNRELEVYNLFGQGLKKKQIADQLNLSVKTIETYTEHIKKKMRFNSIHELLMNAFKFVNSNV